MRLRARTPVVSDDKAIIARTIATSLSLTKRKPVRCNLVQISERKRLTRETGYSVRNFSATNFSSFSTSAANLRIPSPVFS